MTINIPIETYKRYLEAKRILEKIVLSVHTGILSDDLNAAKKIIEELRRWPIPGDGQLCPIPKGD